MDKALAVGALCGLVSAMASSALGAGCAKGQAPREDDPTCAVSPAESVGIAECDAYLCKYEACVQRSKVMAAGAKSAIKAQRDSFKLAAQSVEGKPGLKATCVSKLEQLAADPACASK